MSTWPLSARVGSRVGTGVGDGVGAAADSHVCDDGVFKSLLRHDVAGPDVLLDEVAEDRHLDHELVPTDAPMLEFANELDQPELKAVLYKLQNLVVQAETQCASTIFINAFYELEILSTLQNSDKSIEYISVCNAVYNEILSFTRGVDFLPVVDFVEKVKVLTDYDISPGLDTLSPDRKSVV